MWGQRVWERDGEREQTPSTRTTPTTRGRSGARNKVQQLDRRTPTSWVVKPANHVRSGFRVTLYTDMVYIYLYTTTVLHRYSIYKYIYTWPCWVLDDVLSCDHLLDNTNIYLYKMLLFRRPARNQTQTKEYAFGLDEEHSGLHMDISFFKIKMCIYQSQSEWSIHFNLRSTQSTSTHIALLDVCWCMLLCAATAHNIFICICCVDYLVNERENLPMRIGGGLVLEHTQSRLWFPSTHSLSPKMYVQHLCLSNAVYILYICFFGNAIDGSIHTAGTPVWSAAGERRSCSSCTRLTYFSIVRMMGEWVEASTLGLRAFRELSLISLIFSVRDQTTITAYSAVLHTKNS